MLPSIKMINVIEKKKGYDSELPIAFSRRSRLVGAKHENYPLNASKRLNYRINAKLIQKKIIQQ